MCTYMFDHEQYAIGLEHAPHLAQAAQRITNRAEYQSDDDTIKALVREGQAFHWGLGEIELGTRAVATRVCA